MFPFFQYLILHVFTILEDIILLGIHQPRTRDSVEINGVRQGMNLGNISKHFKNVYPQQNAIKLQCWFLQFGQNHLSPGNTETIYIKIWPGRENVLQIKEGRFYFYFGGLFVCTFKTDFTSVCAKALSLDYGKKTKVEVGSIRLCHHWAQKVLRNSFHTNIFLFFEKQLHVPISEFTFIEIAFEENLN